MTSWHYLVLAAAIVAITTTTAADSTRIPSASSSQPLPTALTAPPQTPILEVDVIYPIANQTYNITTSLPIVIALRNLSAAAALGNFSFFWDIMSWGDVGEPVEPAGITEAHYWFFFTPETAPTEPWIMVNQTDVSKWQHGPRYPYGSVYALQWGLQWDSFHETCAADPPARWGGKMLFNVHTGMLEPGLGNLTECPQFGAAMEVHPTPGVSDCKAVATALSTGDPCGLTVDKAMVTSISSEWQRLITASADATAARSAPTATSSSGAASGLGVPLGLLAAAGVLLA